jgi:hypothetical protein
MSTGNRIWKQRLVDIGTVTAAPTKANYPEVFSSIDPAFE